MGIRDDIMNIALSVSGMGAQDVPAGRKQDYINLIAPGETAAMQSAMCTMSGCGLTVAGIWRRAGLVHSKLVPPYKIGTGVSRLCQIAYEKHAWLPYKKNMVPQVGDMVLVGNNTAQGGIEHVYTVTSVRTTDKGEVVLESVDGGQRDPERHQLILTKNRVWRNGKDVVFQGSDPGSNLYGGRIIIGFADIAKIFE